jgi:membrane associated rhomboid family serine protease
VTPWVVFLLVANGAVYLVLNQLLAQSGQLGSLLAFQPIGLLAQPWTLITYMFVHGSFGHLFWNMLALFFFGPRVELRLGGARFIGLYVVSGLAGALLSFINPYVYIIGASGAVFGVQLAYARYWPRDRILIWGILPVEAWILVVVMTAVSLFGGLGQMGNVAHWAHLGGFAGAALYLAVIERISPARQFRAESRVPLPGRLGERATLEKWSRIRGDSLHEVNRSELERIQRVLAERGMSGLTADERAFMERFSPR